jgi:hypothetical protein
MMREVQLQLDARKPWMREGEGEGEGKGDGEGEGEGEGAGEGAGAGDGTCRFCRNHS